MTEIRFPISLNEIEMLKDFLDPDTRCNIDDIALQWTDELYSLLRSIGHIVTAPGFEIRLWRDKYNLPPIPKPENTIEAFMESILFWKTTIENLKDEKDRSPVEETGWYLMHIANAEDKIRELETKLENL